MKKYSTPALADLRQQAGFTPTEGEPYGKADSMFPLSLDLLQRVVDPHIKSFRHTAVKTGAGPSTVFRITLEYPPCRQGLNSVILKSTAPAWPNDPHGADREALVYSALLPNLDIPRLRVYYVGVEPNTGCRQMIMEDISDRYRFPSPAHRWTREEMRCMLRTYARLHVVGRDCLPAAADRTWLYQMALQQRNWSPEELVAKVDALVERGIWSPLAGVERLVERTLAGIASFVGGPTTLLHNDVYPPNVAIPRNLADDALLVDWEMAGYGPAELDLAFIFLQPFRSALHLDRAEVLNYYWARRSGLEGVPRSADEQEAMQRSADAVWALSLVPVACSVAAKPYPSGSAPAAYWDAMFGVLYDRLRTLCRGD